MPTSLRSCSSSHPEPLLLCQYEAIKRRQRQQSTRQNDLYASAVGHREQTIHPFAQTYFRHGGGRRAANLSGNSYYFTNPKPLLPTHTHTTTDTHTHTWQRHVQKIPKTGTVALSDNALSAKKEKKEKKNQKKRKAGINSISLKSSGVVSACFCFRSCCLIVLWHNNNQFLCLFPFLFFFIHHILSSFSLRSSFSPISSSSLTQVWVFLSISFFLFFLFFTTNSS